MLNRDLMGPFGCRASRLCKRDLAGAHARATVHKIFRNGVAKCVREAMHAQ